MRPLRAWIIRLGSLISKTRLERDMADELDSHLQLHIEDNLRAGMTAEEARRRALIQLGGLDQAKEVYRDRRGAPMIETLWQDIRYAARMLRKNPMFTFVAIFTLALGIGANTAIFSLIDTVMLRALPVQKPEELVRVERLIPAWGSDPSSSFTNPLWEQVRDRQDVFSGVMAWGGEPFDLAQGGVVQNANGLFVSGSYFGTLGVRPASGRLLSPADDQRGCPALAVLSYGFWQSHFGGDRGAVGSSISLSHHSFQIIGVSAPGFYGTEVGHNFDVAVPVCASRVFDEKESRLDHRAWWWLNIMGRIKPGLSREQVAARLKVLSPQISAAALPTMWDSKSQKNFLTQTLVATPAATGISDLRRQFNQPLEILMGVVGLVLLIACANIASLMLARAATRHKEIAVRQALGASRWRLMRQLITECLLLSSAGALLGLLFARWGSALLVHYISTSHDPVFLDLSPDVRVLGFTAVMAVFAGILFGVLPAFRSTRVSLASAMKGAAESEHHGRPRATRWIVASQVALSLVLLVAAGLFLRSFAKLATLDIGFDRRNVLLVDASIKASEIPPEQRQVLFAEIETRLRALPGVVAASRSWNTPVSGMEWNQFIEADTPHPPTGEASLAYLNSISPTYFETLGTPLLAGRAFSDQDTKSGPAVTIINQSLARKFYPGMNPLGRTFKMANVSGKFTDLVQIVGLVKDSKYESLREETFPTAFFPIAQKTPGEVGGNETFELRTATPPSTLALAVQNAVAGVNKGISLNFHTLAEQVNDSLVQERMLALLSGFFGALALLLAMVGLYGALSYLVNQRQTEFGLRMALGAPRASILWLVMRDVGVILLMGVMAGIGISLAATRVLQSLLFGLGPRDTVTLLAAAGVLAAVGLIAGYLPARRATQVDPMVALRYE